MQKENTSNDKLFFEDLDPLTQETIIDLIVSIIKNKQKNQGAQLDQAKEK